MNKRNLIVLLLIFLYLENDNVCWSFDLLRNLFWFLLVDLKFFMMFGCVLGENILEDLSWFVG